LLAGTLITYAYYLSGVVNREFEDLSATQTTDGVQLLNDVLAKTNATGRFVPYYTLISITGVPGQETYQLPNVIDIMTATFNIGNVRYEINQDQLRHYYGAARVDGINALPFSWFWQRVPGGAEVSLYFAPESNYELNFFCKVGLTNVTLNTELDVTYDESFQLYLRYKLAQYICQWNSITLPDSVKEEIRAFEVIYANYNADDYSIKKIATLSKRTSLTYAQANIGKGWTAP